MKLLAVDPSVRSCGLAFFDGDRLIKSGRIFADTSDEDMAIRCLRMAVKIAAWLTEHHLEPDELVFEWPKILTVGKSKGDPNDLIPMASVASALAAILSMRYQMRGIYSPKPDQWIGNIPKQCHACKRTPGARSCKVCNGSAWKTPRGTLIRECLRDYEIAIVADQHDEIDAVGIGLWKRKRLVIRRVFPGAV